MIHTNRPFSATEVATAEELAEKLTKHSWTLCTGFRFSGHLFLNDSFSEDGAAEYAVIRESDGVQVESITFGWCSEEQALGYIKQVVEPTDAEDTRAFPPKVTKVRPHPAGSCHLCA